MKDLAYKKLEVEIARRIQDGVYAPGMQLPTELELVAEFQVSRMTVAKGLSNLISSGAIERIRGRGTFVRKCAASPTAENAPRLIKCLFPGQVSQQAFASNGLLEGVCDTLKDSGFHVGVSFYGTTAEVVAMLREARESGCAGYVLWPSLSESFYRELNALQASGFPLVLVDCLCPGFVGDFVGTDNFSGAQMMIDHLVELGHRRIAYLTIPTERSSLAERLAGVLAGFSRYRLSFSQEDIGVIPEINVVLPEKSGALNVDFIEQWLRTLMERPARQRPTALFASNDFVAMTVLELLQRMAYRVPADVAVAAFDNVDRGAWLPVPLTTAAHDFYEIGRLSGRILLETIAVGTGGERVARQYRVPAQLIRRASTVPRSRGGDKLCANREEALEYTNRKG